MYRKLLAAVAASLFVVGGLFAEEIKGVFKKFEDNKLTIDVDGKEKTFPVDTDAKIKRKGKDGQEKEFELTKMLASPFMKTGETKLTVTVENDKVTNARPEFRGGFKGKNKTQPKDN